MRSYIMDNLIIIPVVNNYQYAFVQNLLLTLLTLVPNRVNDIFLLFKLIFLFF